MTMMTKSQIDHFKADCHQLQFKVRSREENSLKEFLDKFLEPFLFRIEEKKLTVEITESYDPMPLPLQLMSSFNNVRHLLCTDWEIYKHIIFHLL